MGATLEVDLAPGVHQEGRPRRLGEFGRRRRWTEEQVEEEEEAAARREEEQGCGRRGRSEWGRRGRGRRR